MASITTADAQVSMALLAEKAAERSAEMDKYNSDPDRTDTDEENDSECPLFDSFYAAGGSSSILELTNFNARRFQNMWSKFSKTIDSFHNVGRGIRSKYTGKDCIFTMMVMLKQGGACDFLGRNFGIKGPTFEGLMCSFMTQIADAMYDYCVTRLLTTTPMHRVISEGKAFKSYPYARYATDVTFQQANRPSGNLQERRRYFSGKHTLYGFKVEVSVLPTGLAVGYSDMFPGSVSDVDIFHRMHGWHDAALEKSEDVDGFEENGIGIERYPEHWAALCDKGYQGGMEFTRTVHPKKEASQWACNN